MSAQQYLAQLQGLLPQGAAWTRDNDAKLTALLNAFADEYARVDERGDQLIDEADPRTTSDLLGDWERVAGLPDICVGAELSTAQRRALLVQKLTNQGGQSRAYFISVAAMLGITITITEFLPHDVEKDVEFSLYGDDWAYVWQVNAPLNSVFEMSCEDSVDDPLAAWSNAPLECVLNRLKPAHTTIIFAYT